MISSPRTSTTSMRRAFFSEFLGGLTPSLSAAQICRGIHQQRQRVWMSFKTRESMLPRRIDRFDQIQIANFLPPFLNIKGQRSSYEWIKDSELDQHDFIAASPNGWADNELGRVVGGFI
ncbi:hypothetical protein BDN70DRAFT_573150 [Pholiota conissans]|uniref:Uncharacterized protein n=1 Tax=Pholiota conissans TaxID=109636 RepID=A0A9P5Z6A9_9AGAR|nr:hypothetical protein BDN70DRAFT_573150 [Pholiota conissans]